MKEIILSPELKLFQIIKYKKALPDKASAFLAMPFLCPRTMMLGNILDKNIL